MNRMPRVKPREKWYMTGFFPGILYGTQTHFLYLEDYFSKVSTYLESQATAFRRDIEATVVSAGLQEIEAQGYYEAHAEQFEMWNSSFPNIIRKTVLVSACSLMEASLTDVCKYLERDLGGTIQTSVTSTL